MTINEQIDEVVGTKFFGVASAAKRGRNPKFPYVPVIDHGWQDRGVHRTRTEQILGKAFETRDQAVDYAARVIIGRREELRTRLAKPNLRALRESYGLPREC